MRKHLLTLALAGLITTVMGANAALADYASPAKYRAIELTCVYGSRGVR